MDARRFEALSRAVGHARDRRAVLGVLAGALLGGAVLVRQEQPVEAGLPIVGCKPPGKKCKKKQDCCSGRCKNKRCQCSAKGRACWNPLEGALCCSGRCHDGKCN
jgi:hypothetical protein